MNSLEVLKTALLLQVMEKGSQHPAWSCLWGRVEEQWYRLQTTLYTTEVHSHPMNPFCYAVRKRSAMISKKTKLGGLPNRLSPCPIVVLGYEAIMEGNHFPLSIHFTLLSLYASIPGLHMLLCSRRTQTFIQTLGTLPLLGCDCCN
jgi:hypothetical protein